MYPAYSTDEPHCPLNDAGRMSGNAATVKTIRSRHDDVDGLYKAKRERIGHTRPMNDPARVSRNGVIAALAAVLFGCAKPFPSERAKDADVATRFDGERAMRRLETLMDWPRTLGLEAREESIAMLDRALAAQGARVMLQSFEVYDAPSERTYALTNIFANFRPEQPPRFVLATHFDTRPWADEDPDPRLRDQPVPGANDGTSGVAVVLELAALLNVHLPPTIGFSVILFDGEELGHPQQGGYCAGSRHFEAMASRPGDLPPDLGRIVMNARFGIVFDMVGDADLRIPVERQSNVHHPQLVEALWSTAEALGSTAFVREAGVGILDDHVFLTRAGIPSVLLIDSEYDPWHTHGDTLDRVSAASLQDVGEVVFQTIMRLQEEGAVAGPPTQSPSPSRAQ